MLSFREDVLITVRWRYAASFTLLSNNMIEHGRSSKDDVYFRDVIKWMFRQMTYAFVNYWKKYSFLVGVVSLFLFCLRFLFDLFEFWFRVVLLEHACRWNVFLKLDCYKGDLLLRLWNMDWRRATSLTKEPPARSGRMPDWPWERWIGCWRADLRSTDAPSA